MIYIVSHRICLFYSKGSCLLPNFHSYNGQAFIDEDLLRSTGVTDFVKYRCDPDREPDRMMPKVFPSLRVAEEEENKSKL